MPSRWSPSTCPVEFLLICGIFRNRPPERSVIHYTVRACDVPPNNAATVTVAEPRPKSPNRPSQGLPHSCHNRPIPQSAWKLSQPQEQRACPPPLPDQLAAAASAVFSLQTQKSRAASQQQRQLGEQQLVQVGAGRWRPRLLAMAKKRLSRSSPASWTLLEVLIGCLGTKLIIWVGFPGLSFPPIQLRGGANV